MKFEETIEAIRVMDAWVKGKSIECAERNNLKWGDTLSPVWNWNVYTYRIKPTSKFRTWTPDEVPLGAQMRRKIDLHRFLIGSVADDSSRQHWLENNEHSIDGGKTWKPCGVEEPE
jgi:hypothetical protein